MKIKNDVLTHVLEEFKAESTVVENTESYTEENRRHSMQR
jgi:hypothetical protein